MKSFKMLMMAILIIISVSVFGQVSTNNQKKIANQKSEKEKYTCPMNPVIMDRLCTCPKFATTLNLSPKEKMKREVMKIYPVPMNNEVTSDMPCNLLKAVATLNRSPKEKMKIDAMRVYNSSKNPYVTDDKIYKEPNSGMDLRVSDKQNMCFYYRHRLNLSLKEKMKMEVMKI